MNEDVFVPLLLAFGVFFIGYYGFVSERWSYRIYTFGFAPVAGLLFGFGVMKIAFPELSWLTQLAVGAAAVVVMSLLLLLLFMLMQRRWR
jgi:hypothetical protein